MSVIMQNKRVYLRVDALVGPLAIVEIPDWHEERFTITISSFPYEMRPYLHPGFRCSVVINFDVDKPAALGIRDWRPYE